jgi:homogentisate 1,2-dioxygenase
MPIYHKLGQVPHKRHTQFRNPKGELYQEHLFGVKGFSGMYSLLYRHYSPCEVRKVEFTGKESRPKLAGQSSLMHKHLALADVKPEGTAVSGRVTLLINEDISIGYCLPKEAMTDFYTNALCDEVIFVHEGQGKFASMFGSMDYRAGDYIVIPKGTIYQLQPVLSKPTRYLVIETPGNIDLPKKYLNEYGQLLEHSPYYARDFRLPQELFTSDERGDFIVDVKGPHNWVRYHMAHHPFDVVGWDGYLYPYIFNIEDFEPITGRVHQPPPVHQTFAGPNFVLCSFVPRLFDYHPQAVPVPYNHSNVQSDEVLYYVSGDFMSRKGIGKASITLHPAGIPHGPHPGTVEPSLGKQKTEEVAVMVDTFRPLHLTEVATRFEDSNYAQSWLIAD